MVSISPMKRHTNAGARVLTRSSFTAERQQTEYLVPRSDD
jgi:hypothetical protein